MLVWNELLPHNASERVINAGKPSACCLLFFWEEKAAQHYMVETLDRGEGSLATQLGNLCLRVVPGPRPC